MPATVPLDVALPLYRIAQEALRNVAKHAKATQVRVRLSCEEDQLRLSIADDGVGFSAQPRRRGHLGWLSMQERMRLVEGRLVIEARPGHGVQVEASAPLSALHGCA